MFNMCWLFKLFSWQKQTVFDVFNEILWETLGNRGINWVLQVFINMGHETHCVLTLFGNNFQLLPMVNVI